MKTDEKGKKHSRDSLFHSLRQFYTTKNGCFLSEDYIRDDLSASVGIETGGKFAALHMELLAKHGRGELYVECLVTDGEVFGIACNDRPHHMLPPLDEAVLVERSLEALLAEKLADEVAYSFGIGTLHFLELKDER